jgi:trans-2,3-dihydro-3-hydroxyanthranilate isomerase
VATWDFRIVDAFTDRPLAGNQLAVFEDATGIPETLFQALAREIGFSETVFVLPATGEADARMRIFTPRSEIPFAGHPTLGTAVLLGTRLAADRVVLETQRGLIPVRIERGASMAVRGMMEQPIPSDTPYPAATELLAALGVARSLLPITLYDNGIPHVYVLLETPDAVAALEPNLAALARLSGAAGMGIVGFNVFAGRGTTWKTRMFAPADGIAEDAATGSAAGPLALHLARHELIPWGTEIHIAQGAEIGRPSELFARASGNAERVERIEVSGYAAPVGGGWFDAALLSPVDGR